MQYVVMASSGTPIILGAMDTVNIMNVEGQMWLLQVVTGEQAHCELC